jgi:hypothetical protein
VSREQYEDDFLRSLAKLETCLETPRVAGELPSWAAAVQEGFADVGSMLSRQLDSLHAEEYAEIVEEDSGLFARVEQLKKEDCGITEQFADLCRRAERLAEIAWRVEPDEGQVREDVSRLVELGLSFVIRVRTQETAITTWLVEAFDRDRGTVD